MKITFVQTGGSIDKVYPQRATNHGYDFDILEAASIEIIKKSRVSFTAEHISLLKKDSIDITDADRQMLCEKISKIRNEYIIITHGTDTMYKTAQKLSGIKNKKIILTGSMLPAAFSASEAMFNLGMAIGAVQALTSPGVFIAMYGRCVPWQEFPEVAKKATAK